MTQKLKILTILGTRPEIIRLSRILPKMDEYFNHIIVYTRQSYDFEMSDIFFKELKLKKPDYVLDVKSPSLGGQLANIFKQCEEVLLKEKPDALFVLGDTNSILSTILAKRMHIPIIHMEAGTRCFDWEHPEEINRVIVDHIADVNLAYSEGNRRNLIQEGLHVNSLYVVGSPMKEVLEYYMAEIDASQILEDLKLENDRYFVISTHREENVEDEKRLKGMFSTFNYLAEEYGLPLIVTLHPRTKEKLRMVGKLNPLIKLHKPFGFLDYVKLQKNALCVLSDSGTLEEEGAILKFPVVFIRNATQKPEVYDKGSVVLGGTNADLILTAVKLVLDQKAKGEEILTPDDYQDTNVSTKVVKLILRFVGLHKYNK